MWQSLLNESIATRPQGPLLATLATVDDVAGVDARIVVCREIAPDGSLWFTSDSRSAKNAQLSKSSNAAAVMWLAHCRRQFRFHGVVDIAVANADCLRIWEQLLDSTKATFFWPAPGEVRTSGQFETIADLSVVPEAFSVLKLTPHVVELLELEPFPHRRRRWQSSQAWRTEELNP
jgi:hypothetical protein